MNKRISEELNEGYNYMHARGVEAFRYYVGQDSLADLATRQDRVCVLNILGTESRSVTPISHAFSGGNVVCGTMPGRSGSTLPTPIGAIPVYNNVLEALNAGHRFNVAIVYLPPAGVKGAVVEAVRVNPELKKIFIITEKVRVKDARVIRHYCQWRGVDVFGANSLGVADAHHRVRIGGALGGGKPHESLIPGSVAIYSNSGNFTTTLAVYLATAGWGTTTSVSSGKDVYIHYAAAEFAHALHNDARSKAAVLYIEPGGYYERDVVFSKPVVACVVGHWKARLTRPCGHAGAVIGEGDSAGEKERWFMEKFGVDGLYTPSTPVCSPRGAIVNNITYVPQAMTDVMKLGGIEPDFEPRGNLNLKCWFVNTQGLDLPAELRSPVVEAAAPYNQQVDALNQQVGVVFPRQAMKDASGASRMDPRTQVTAIHGVSVLDAATHSVEDNFVHALVTQYPDETSRALANVALNALVNLAGTPELAAAEAARAAGNSPNTVLAAALALVGPRRAKPASEAARALVELFGLSGLDDPADMSFDATAQLARALEEIGDSPLVTREPCAVGASMRAAIEARGVNSVFVRFVADLADKAGGSVSRDLLLAAITTHLAWKALMRKRLSLRTVIALPWHFQLFSTLVGTAAVAQQHEPQGLCGVDLGERLARWSFGATACQTLLGRQPTEQEVQAFSLLIGLVISNGPGTISAQGAKGAVSADGPESPERVQINKAYLGCLTHTGFAHGGNGYEAIAFLLDQFRDSGLRDAGDPENGLDLPAMARAYAESYKAYKADSKAAGEAGYRKIPCVNHPVFKGKDVNHDPREVFVRELFEHRAEYNVFHRFYHELVRALFDAGVSRNVYCVNVDAVIAVVLLKMLWQPLQANEIDEGALERAAFTAFLFGRTIGAAAEIEDHVSRGRNMDTRTPASRCAAVG